jgi:hypothetical protein
MAMAQQNQDKQKGSSAYTRPESEQSKDQLSTLPESKGAQNVQPPSQRIEKGAATHFDGSGAPTPGQDKPGFSKPQDDTPAFLEKRDGGKVRARDD